MVIWKVPGMPALLGMTLTGFSGYAALLTVAPLWAARGGAGPAGAGAVNGVLMLFTVLTQLLVPRMLGRFGAGRVMAAGGLLLGLPSLLHLLGDTLVPILALSAVRGLGFGILTVTGSAAIALLVEPVRRGAAIGVYGLAIAVPQLVLIPAGPWLAERLGFTAVFLVGAIPLLGVPAALLLGHQLAARGQGPAVTGPRASLRSRAPLLRPMLLLLAVTAAGGALLTFTDHLAASSTLVSIGLFLFTATAALSRWRFGGLADRYGTRPFLWPLVLLTAGGMAAIAWAARGTADRPALLLIAMAVVGVAYGGLQNLTLVISFQMVEPGGIGTASAAWNIGFDAGTGLGAVLVGAMTVVTSFPVGLLALAACALATLPLALSPPPPSPAEGRGS